MVKRDFAKLTGMKPGIRLSFAAIILSAGLTSGCLYTNVHGPRAYRSATPNDVKASAEDERVVGRACNRTVLYLFAWGDGGYAAAVEDALVKQPDAILYDVQSDIQVTSVLLGIYSRICTVVTGKTGRP